MFSEGHSAKEGRLQAAIFHGLLHKFDKRFPYLAHAVAGFSYNAIECMEFSVTLPPARCLGIKKIRVHPRSSVVKFRA
jgi:hypothetical protein